MKEISLFIASQRCSGQNTTPDFLCSFTRGEKTQQPGEKIYFWLVLGCKRCCCTPQAPAWSIPQSAGDRSGCPKVEGKSHPGVSSHSGPAAGPTSREHWVSPQHPLWGSTAAPQPEPQPSARQGQLRSSPAASKHLEIRHKAGLDPKPFIFRVRGTAFCRHWHGSPASHARSHPRELKNLNVPFFFAPHLLKRKQRFNNASSCFLLQTDPLRRGTEPPPPRSAKATICRGVKNQEKRENGASLQEGSRVGTAPCQLHLANPLQIRPGTICKLAGALHKPEGFFQPNLF